MESQTPPNPENQEELLNLKLSKSSKATAGIPAIVSSVKHVFVEMDIARGTKALFSLNQKAASIVRVVLGRIPTMSVRL